MLYPLSYQGMNNGGGDFRGLMPPMGIRFLKIGWSVNSILMCPYGYHSSTSTVTGLSIFCGYLGNNPFAVRTGFEPVEDELGPQHLSRVPLSATQPSDQINTTGTIPNGLYPERFIYYGSLLLRGLGGA